MVLALFLFAIFFVQDQRHRDHVDALVDRVPVVAGVMGEPAVDGAFGTGGSHGARSQAGWAELAPQVPAGQGRRACQEKKKKIEKIK